MISLGLIEGFYGPPWSWDARQRMADALGALRFDLFLHAPKDDALHRLLWREPYLPEEVARFGGLAARCRGQGVDLVVGLSPLGARFGGGDDIAQAIDKLAPLGEAGIDGFAILFDDMPAQFADPADAGRYASLGAAHAMMAGAVLDGLRARTPVRRFLFCPLEYHGAGDSEYLRAIGDGLPGDVDVMWTGREVCSETIQGSDVGAVTAALRRLPLIWDNYPVNDGAMAGDLRLQPIRGRAADLPPAVRGVLLNGALQPEVTLVALHSFRTWADDPVRYDPESAWPAALGALTERADEREALAVLGDLGRRSPLERRPVTRMGAFADAFWTAWHAGDRSEAMRLARQELRTLRGALSVLERLSNRRLAEEIAAWTRRLAAWTQAVEAAVEALAEPTRERRAQAIAALERAATGAARLDDRAFESWIRRSLRSAAHD